LKGEKMSDKKGDEIGSRVLNSAGGAYVKRYFDIDCVSFSWVDLYLRDAALRKKIQTLRDNVQKSQMSPIHKNELRAMFESAISDITSVRLSWFVEKLKSAQARQDAILSSSTVQSGQYFPAIDLSKSDIDTIFSRLPEEGVRQVDIDAETQRLQKEITHIEEVIERELCPQNRWKYNDKGKPIPYPQGCQWTQYVIAWKKVAARFDGPVSVEGSSIKSDSEQTAYIALGLNNIGKLPPLRKAC
jgi:hypothetical protein